MPGAPPPSRESFLSGIDVSHHQQAVDWPAVAAAGIRFAYAKATEGGTYEDSAFAANWSGMKDAGLARGAYHFFRPATPVDAQVDRFLSAVQQLDEEDLPPMLDLEETPTTPDEWSGIPMAERVVPALAWLRAVEDALGRRPIVYTRRLWVGQQLGDPGELASYPLWIAHYTTASRPKIPKGWAAWTFWQYSQSGQISGIEGPVDLDRFNGSADEFAALGKIPAPAPPSLT